MEEEINMDDLYCKICSACGEDGCCSALICKQHKDGLYCEGYLRDLKFKASVLDDCFELLEKHCDKEFDDIYDKHWEIFYENKIK